MIILILLILIGILAVWALASDDKQTEKELHNVFERLQKLDLSSVSSQTAHTLFYEGLDNIARARSKVIGNNVPRTQAKNSLKNLKKMLKEEERKWQNKNQ